MDPRAPFAKWLTCSVCEVGTVGSPFPPAWEGYAEHVLSSPYASTHTVPSFWNVAVPASKTQLNATALTRLSLGG